MSALKTFWDVQRQLIASKQQQEQTHYAVAPHKVQPGQIVAARIGVDVAARGTHGSDVSCVTLFSMLPSHHSGGKSPASNISNNADLKFSVSCNLQNNADLANVFLVNDCLVAFGERAIAEGEPLYIDRTTLVPEEFLALPADHRNKLHPFTGPELRAWVSKLSASTKGRVVDNEQHHIIGAEHLKEAAKSFIAPCSHPKLEIRRYPIIGDALTAKERVDNGELINRMTRATNLSTSFPTIFTICSGATLHLMPHGGPEFLAHACDPNTRIVVTADGAIEVYATREILPDEIVSFNYLTSEYTMDGNFPCGCGAPNCFGDIKGFAFRSRDTQCALYNFCTPVVRQLFASEIKKLPYSAPVAFAPGQVVTINVELKTQKVGEQEQQILQDAYCFFPFEKVVENDDVAAAKCNAVLTESGVLVATQEIAAGASVLVAMTTV